MLAHGNRVLVEHALEEVRHIAAGGDVSLGAELAADLTCEASTKVIISRAAHVMWADKTDEEKMQWMKALFDWWCVNSVSKG